MSDSQSETVKATDPLEQWRELRDGYMGAWAKAMGEAVNTEAYAQTSGTMLETYLTASAPFRDAQKKAMLSALEQLHMPSQADFVSLADRLTNIELLLDDMDAKLDQVLQLATSPAAIPSMDAKLDEILQLATSAATKPAMEAKLNQILQLATSAAGKSASEAKAETKLVHEAKAETKPLFQTGAETKPLFEARAETKPAPEVKAEAKAAAPKKSVTTAKKGTR